MECEMKLKLLIVSQCLLLIQGNEYSYSYLGCYRDNSDIRALSTYMEDVYLGLTPAVCVGICGVRGFQYAGLQQSKECYCGNSGYDRYGTSNGCFFPCSGDLAQKCGGKSRSSVYRVGIPENSLAVGSTPTTTTPSNEKSSITRPETTRRNTTSSITNITSSFSQKSTTPDIPEEPKFNFSTKKVHTNRSASPTSSSKLERSPVTDLIGRMDTGDSNFSMVAKVLTKSNSLHIFGTVVGATAACAMILLSTVLIKRKCTKKTTRGGLSGDEALYEVVEDSVDFSSTVAKKEDSATTRDSESVLCYTEINGTGSLAEKASQVLEIDEDSTAQNIAGYIDFGEGPNQRTKQGNRLPTIAHTNDRRLSQPSLPPRSMGHQKGVTDCKNTLINKYHYIKERTPPVYILECTEVGDESVENGSTTTDVIET